MREKTSVDDVNTMIMQELLMRSNEMSFIRVDDESDDGGRGMEVVK
jgi:hypothetical protein